jgi:hypothetical protein
MKKLGLVILAIVILLAGGVAYASIPAADGTINGCYKNNTGALSVIDSAATCPSGSTALNWSQTGPQGPAGGVAGLELVQAFGPIDLAQFKSVTATCPTGKIVIGGGGFTGGGSTVIRDSYASSPSGISPGQSWTVLAYKPVDDGQSWRLSVQAICVDQPTP